jgi:hypothetical protein
MDKREQILSEIKDIKSEVSELKKKAKVEKDIAEIKKIAKQIETLIHKSNKLVDEYSKIKGISDEEHHSCGIVKENQSINEEMGVIDKRRERNKRSAIISKIISDKNVYANERIRKQVDNIKILANEVMYSKNKKEKHLSTSGSGNENLGTTYTDIYIPKFFKTLLDKIKGVVKKGRVRKLDPVDTYISKYPVYTISEGVKRKPYVVMLIDSSGSMAQEYKGKPLLSYDVSFMSKLAMRGYSGEAVIVDTEVKEVIPFKKIKKLKKRIKEGSFGVSVKGGGGTTLKPALEMIIANYLKKENDSIFLIIASDFELSDTDFDLMIEMIKNKIIDDKNIVLLATKRAKRFIPNTLHDYVVDFE